VIASHYASPVPRRLAATATLFVDASEATPIAQLETGESFDLLDDSLGWAWGYAGTDRRVGYVRSEALSH
jgi:hypothetical protein